MQISALEVAKLIAKDGAVLPGRGAAAVEIRAVTADILPKTVEPDAVEVARFVEAVKAAPDVREDVVMRLKERIEKGEYDVSGADIADMMIRRMKADRVR